MIGTATVIRGNALHLPLPDNSVDLICTSPPYFGLRSYQDSCSTCRDGSLAGRPRNGYMKICEACDWTGNRKGSCLMCGARMKDMPQDVVVTTECPDCGGTGSQHYAGQIGSEATPAEFLEALLAATREMVRVLKPSGSIFVNLGDKYSGSGASPPRGLKPIPGHSSVKWTSQGTGGHLPVTDIPTKSLMGIPWRYAIRCIDQLELILRAEIIWSKPNGLPESVTDRVRRSHEQWFHFTKQPRYFAAVDEIREAQTEPDRRGKDGRTPRDYKLEGEGWNWGQRPNGREYNPLGKLPGSVWTIPTQPLEVPPELGVDHFAAYPMEWPRRIIQGWTPIGICTVCGEGRRPLVNKELVNVSHEMGVKNTKYTSRDKQVSNTRLTFGQPFGSTSATITGYTCACPTGDFDCCTEPAPTRPAVVLDPFGGTGTTALVAKALGRHGITIDLSAEYSRLAQWRCNNPGELAKALQVEKPEVVPDGQEPFDFGALV